MLQVKKIESAFADRLITDTNTLINISTSDKYMRSLANAINIQLRNLRAERHRFRQRDIPCYPLGTTDEYFTAPYEEYPVTICSQAIILTNGKLAAALFKFRFFAPIVQIQLFHPDHKKPTAGRNPGTNYEEDYFVKVVEYILRHDKKTG